MKNSIALLAIGSELLDGRVLEKNANYCGKILHDHGLSVRHILSCTDELSDILKSLAFLKSQSAFVIISGGLGPTTDDLTRQAVAEFFSSPLQLDVTVEAKLKAFCASRNRPYTESQAQQAYFPVDAQILPNLMGTAPGFAINKDNLWLAALPGVPYEFEPMFNDSVLPEILKASGAESRFNELVWRVHGLAESQLQDMLKTLQIPQEIEQIFSVSFPEIKFILRSRAVNLDQWESRVDQLLGREHVFARDLKSSLAEVTINACQLTGLKIAIAESCTGGMLGELLSSVPGSSRSFQGGVITYSDASKVDLINVQQATLDQFGAVSAETAGEMARGVRQALSADLGVSITGIAGPAGGSPDKPVGTVYFGLATAQGLHTVKAFFPWDRQRVRRAAAFTGLELLRRQALGIGQK